jgi:hypothetical protein
MWEDSNQARHHPRHRAALRCVGPAVKRGLLTRLPAWVPSAGGEVHPRIGPELHNHPVRLRATGARALPREALRAAAALR